MEALCILLLVLPFLGAVIVSGLRGRASDWVAGPLAFVTLWAGLLVIATGYQTSPLIYLGWLPWLPTETTNLLGFLIDPLSSLMLFVVVILGFLVVLYSTDYVGPRNREHAVRDGKGRYYFWMLTFIGSMVGVALSPNFFQLFIFWELTTLCSWALISYYEDEESLRAGFKALIMTHVGGLFLMTAIVILFVHTHSFDFTALSRLSPSLRNTVFVLILIGAWAKASQVPFYTWLPDAMAAPTPVSAYLHAAAMVKAGVYLTARTVFSSGGLSYGAGLLVGLMALLSMFIAVFLFFFQDDLKRLLALSTIAHLAYILIGCALGVFGSTVGFQGGLVHIAAHAAGKGLLFLSVGALAYFSGSKRISELRGVGTKLPLVAVGFFVGAFTVTGVPPFAGFWSKFYLITGALETGGFGSLLAVLMLLESMIAFGWFLWVGQRVFFGEPSPVALQIGSSSAPIEIALVLLILLCLLAPAIALPFARVVVI